jgi:hypothetical protein
MHEKIRSLSISWSLVRRVGRRRQVGGFALLQANSKEEAIELVKQFLHLAGDGECELRQVFDAPQAQSAAKS